MVSRLTTPDRRRTSARFAGAGSVAGVLWLMLSVAGCPLREKEIRFTETGVNWLLSACPRGGGGLPPPGGGGGGFGGNGPGGGGPGGSGGGFPDPNALCLLENGYPASFSGRPIEARLFLISPDSASPGRGRVQDASKCMSLHPCGDGGRGGPSANCIASDLNQQLDGAMPNGVGFDGLKNPEEAQLVLAFYQPTEVTEQGGGCHRPDLFACAGLAAPLGGGAYDISCASCQGGNRNAPGSDNGPCPKGLPMTNSCFLKICDELLGFNGFE